METGYILKRKTWTSKLSLKINQNGEVIVTGPKLLPKTIIDNFVSHHLLWIKKNQKKISQFPKLIDYQNREVTIFGLKYNFIITNQANQKQIVYLQKTQLIINSLTYIPPDKELIFIKKKLAYFFYQLAFKYLNLRTKELALKMNLVYQKLTIKNLKSKWGSCSNKKNLNFNFNLIALEPKVIDYVIIHELCHLKELNHSKKFWLLVAKYEPHYQKFKKILNKSIIAI